MIKNIIILVIILAASAFYITLLSKTEAMKDRIKLAEEKLNYVSVLDKKRKLYDLSITNINELNGTNTGLENTITQLNNNITNYNTSIATYKVKISTLKSAS